MLHGWSMGGATALRAAPGTGVAAVVEEAGYGDLPLLLRGKIPEFVRFGGLLEPAILLAGRLFPDFDSRDVVPKREAAKLSDEGVPLFIIHSTEDDMVPYEQAKILAAAYPEASVWTLEGYGHVEAYEHPEYAWRLRGFSMHPGERGRFANRPYTCVSIRAWSCGSVKSFAVVKAPASRSVSGSWLEAMPTVGMPAATEEEMPETESSKARASSAGTPVFSRAAL